LIASGFWPVSAFSVVASVFASTIATLFSRPLVVKSRPSELTTATPWTPGVSAIRPTTAFLSVSTTTTSVVCARYSRLPSLSIVR
jgi:hypothetical protein